MTDLTDQDRRAARAWAKNWQGDQDDDTSAAARVILATVDAPEPTLSEELMDWSHKVFLDEGGKQTMRDYSALAKQMEQDAEDRQEWNRRITEQVATLARERDEVRDELERVRAVVDPKGAGLPPGMTISEAVQTLVDGIPTGERVGLTDAQLKREYDLIEARVEAALNNLDKAETVPVQKGAESNAETPDPADVKPGEAWMVECHREWRTAVKDRDDDEPWNTFTAGGLFFPEENENVTLVTRLVPAPRVITNTDDLEALSHCTVIRDSAGVMFQRIVHGWYQAGDTSVHRSDDNFVCLPATVLWEPEA